MSLDIHTVKSAFARCCGCLPDFIVAAPGRVNLIGEHTDYNGGFVLPIAINREIVLAATRRQDQTLRAFAASFDQAAEIDLAHRPFQKSAHSWVNYILAVADQLRSRGIALPGLDLIITSDIPIGAGLSSSAALEVAVATLLCAASGRNLSPEEMATLCQAAEHSEFVGVQCGIMDQMVACLARKGHALALDCFSLTWQLVPLNFADAALLVMNTMVKRELAASQYNTRRAECARALSFLQERLGTQLSSLGQCSPEQFEAIAGDMPDLVRRRARHVITENQRVHAAVKALRAGDVKSFGHLLYQSHNSLRDDYDVSCAELDCLVESSREMKGVLGARMTGAGFGGCTLHLIKNDYISETIDALSDRYRARFGFAPEVYLVASADASRILESS